MTALIIALSVAGGLVLVVSGQRRRSFDPLEELLAATGTTPAPEDERSQRVIGVVRSIESWVGGPLSRLGSEGGVRRIERELVLAGLSGRIRVAEVLGMQALGAAAGLALGALFVSATAVHGRLAASILVLLTLVGGIAPRTTLRRRATRRQAQIHSRVSDALDLLTLCLEAGLAFDAALMAVSEAVPDPLGGELSRAVAEMGLGLSRAEALENLRTRNQSSALDALVVSVVQADALGSPLSGVLSGHAAEARVRRRQEARERAGSLPVRILLPTVLLVFPPTFVILLGPAAMSIRGAF